MKKIFFIAGAVIVFTSCNQKAKTTAATETTTTTETVRTAEAPKGQYEFKSGILEMETTMPGMGTSTTKITFDDYGKLKVTETNMAMSMGGHSMNTSSKSLIKDDYAYTWTAMSKTGMKFKMDPSKMDPKKDLDISKLTDEMKAKMHMKQVSDETIDGKDCKVFTYETETMKGKLWLWKELPIQTEMNIGGKTIMSKYKSFQENPTLPAGTFDVPSDIEFKEMNLPSTASK